MGNGSETQPYENFRAFKAEKISGEAEKCQIRNSIRTDSDRFRVVKNIETESWGIFRAS